MSAISWNRVYDRLIEVCGADERLRPSFIGYMGSATDHHEFRFQGSLGFGGKFHRSIGKCWVSCYREDETPERVAAIVVMNEWIKAQRASVGRDGESG